MGIFLKFDFRNGALRKKYDGLKYTLKKMENTLRDEPHAGGGEAVSRGRGRRRRAARETGRRGRRRRMSEARSGGERCG